VLGVALHVLEHCLAVQNHSFMLDPPSIIFITRMHLMSVIRRKRADAAEAALVNNEGRGAAAAAGRFIFNFNKIFLAFFIFSKNTKIWFHKKI